MSIVKKIDEHLCKNGIKIQKWKSETGYDIVVIDKGIIISTYFTPNPDNAHLMFEKRITEFENKTF